MIKVSTALATCALTASLIAAPAVTSIAPTFAAQQAATTATGYAPPCERGRHSEECAARRHRGEEGRRHRGEEGRRHRGEEGRRNPDRGYVGESPLTGQECTGGIEVGCPG
ncbi:hypothetical protein SAMN05421874_107116 [Nonomuraea maritima]|uniref:Uncharacterized protein n=1 Tax=Nonomuraea maritima TaxID=683260 RepID=A0A1G9BDZ7_9ACTN|nr:hypothetical protein [Nonomuraea maritima]SDK37304.1 hypothetical protein SAMN05421874_107116 [Nonomuraea maritima]